MEKDMMMMMMMMPGNLKAKIGDNLIYFLVRLNVIQKIEFRRYFQHFTVHLWRFPLTANLTDERTVIPKRLKLEKKLFGGQR